MSWVREASLPPAVKEAIDSKETILKATPVREFGVLHLVLCEGNATEKNEDILLTK